MFREHSLFLPGMLRTVPKEGESINKTAWQYSKTLLPQEVISLFLERATEPACYLYLSKNKASVTLILLKDFGES